jgi:pimeloyl-ACP methyl ester carboxylesterase
MRFVLVAGAIVVAAADTTSIFLEDYPVQGFCGQEDSVEKSWFNTHYLFPTVFGGFKEGNCSDIGYTKYNSTVVIEKSPIPWRHHNLTFKLFAPTQTKTVTLEFADPSRPGRMVMARFCMPMSKHMQPLYIFGHGAGCAADDYMYFCQVAATASIFQKSPAGDIFPVDFDSPSAALDAKFLAQHLPKVAQDPSSSLFGKLDGRVILGGHSMGGGMTVLAAGKERTGADGIALFAPGLYTKPDATPFLKNITVPALVVSGAMDCDANALNKQAQPLFDGLASSTKVLVVLKGANHCQWTYPTEKGLGVCKTFEKNECHGIPRAAQQLHGAELFMQFAAGIRGKWQDFEDFLSQGEKDGTWTFVSSKSSDPSKVLHNDCALCNGANTVELLTV